MPPEKDYYYQKKIMNSLVGVQMERIDDEFMCPMSEAMREGGWSFEDLSKYSMALHAPDFNKLMQSRNGNPEESAGYAGRGFTDDEAAQIVDDYASNPHFETLKKANEYLQAMNQHSLKMRRDAGLIDNYIYTKWQSQSPFYVPLHVLNLDVEMGLARDEFSERDLSRREFMKAYGHVGRENINAVAQSLFQAYDGVNRSFQNMALNEFARYLQSRDKEKVLGNGIQIKRIEELTDKVKNYILENRDFLIPFKRNGRLYYIE